MSKKTLRNLRPSFFAAAMRAKGPSFLLAGFSGQIGPISWVGSDGAHDSAVEYWAASGTLPAVPRMVKARPHLNR